MSIGRSTLLFMVLITSTLAPAQSITVANAPLDPPKLILQILQRAPLTGDESKEAVIASAEFAPGAATGRHTHPGDEYAVVLEGTVEIIADGLPQRRVSGGGSYHNARNVVHQTRNVGAGVAKVVSTFIIDRGQPIMTPASIEKSIDEAAAAQLREYLHAAIG